MAKGLLGLQNTGTCLCWHCSFEAAKPISAVWRCPQGTRQEGKRLGPCKASPAPRKALARLSLPLLRHLQRVADTGGTQAVLARPLHCKQPPAPCSKHRIALELCGASEKSSVEALPMLPEHGHALASCLDPLTPRASIPHGQLGWRAGCRLNWGAGRSWQCPGRGAGGLQAACNILLSRSPSQPKLAEGPGGQGGKAAGT